MIIEKREREREFSLKFFINANIFRTSDDYMHICFMYILLCRKMCANLLEYIHDNN